MHVCTHAYQYASHWRTKMAYHTRFYVHISMNAFVRINIKATCLPLAPQKEQEPQLQMLTCLLLQKSPLHAPSVSIIHIYVWCIDSYFHVCVCVCAHMYVHICMTPCKHEASVLFTSSYYVCMYVCMSVCMHVYPYMFAVKSFPCKHEACEKRTHTQSAAFAWAIHTCMHQLYIRKHAYTCWCRRRKIKPQRLIASYIHT
jgi:hypothetical protein